jgi:GAF domain-containing protein
MPADSAPLGRTAQLLEEARVLVQRASRDAEERSSELMKRSTELEESMREMEQLLARTERQAAQLANLYVATYQLHASLETSDVRAAVADIAVNLLGAEEFSIWVRDEDGRLARAPESGTHIGKSSDKAVYGGGDALMDACLADPRPQFGPIDGSKAAAAVPFTAQGEVVGVLLVNRFLGHKAGLSAEDHELLDLMAAHAASALLAARAFGVTQRKLQAYEGLLGFLRKGAP